MVGWLNNNEARDVLWVRGELGRTTINVPCGKDKNLAYLIISSSSQIKATLHNGRVVFNIKIKPEASLQEMDFPLDLKKTATLQQMTRDLNRVIRSSIESNIKKIQTGLRSNILGLGQKFYRQQRREWPKYRQNWDDTFARADVSVEVDSLIRRSDLTTDTFPER